MQVLRIYYENLYQELRNTLYYFKNKYFPFGLKRSGTKEQYLKLFNEAKNINYESINKFEKETGFKIDENWLNDLALHTQVVIKKTKICYVHGKILYSALSKYINYKENKNLNINILETGTSRGFSSLCLAKALNDNNSFGKIITIDYLPHDKKFYWNCIDDLQGKKSRRELLSKWNSLCSKYIFFLEGYKKNILKKIKYERIHFAFLDASHTYHAIYDEFSNISNNQKKDDIIIFDDYGNKSYVGLKVAIDDICEKYNYKKEIINSSFNRSYVIATKM